MKHSVQIYFAGYDAVYPACNTCGWKGKIVSTVFEAEHQITEHKHWVGTGFLGIKFLMFQLRAWRYGYKRCPCRSACSSCNGFGYLPTKGCQKFSEDLVGIND